MAKADPRPGELPEQPKPENARQAVTMVRDDARWVVSKPDINSTDGIKRNIEALWAAINRLAEYVDGDSKPTPTVEQKSYQPTPQPKTDYERQQDAASRSQVVG